MQSGSTCQLTKECKTPDRNTVTAGLYQELTDFIAALPQKDGHLVTVLHKAQGLFGYLPREVQQFVADQMGLSLAKVYGVVSFYTFFTMVPKGKHPISVCMGTACFVKGANKLVETLQEALAINVGEVTVDGKFSIDVLRCIGACALAPVMMVGSKVYANVTPDQIKKILDEY